MAAYIVRRLIWVVFLLFMITLITFVIFTVLPSGDPAVLRAGRQPSPELIASIRQQFGLDKPKPVQFINYIGDILPFVGHNGFYFGFSLPEPTDGAAGDPRPAADDDLPHRRRRDPVAVDRHPDRHDLGRQDRLAGSTACSMGIALIFISAPGLLPRPRRALPVRRRHRQVPAAAGQLAPTSEATTLLGEGRGADHAVVRARGRVRGGLRALPARQPDRHAAGGLHPHRAGEGPVRAARDLPPRRARGDHADRHAARPGHRHPARRRDPHRDRLQHPGDRALRLRRDHAAPTCR